MNRIPPDGKSKAPRPRPFWKPPRKPTGRIIKSQVERKEEGANSDDRSTTGSPGLNENLGTPVRPDQVDVTASPRGVGLTKIFPIKDTGGSNPSPPMFSRLNGWAVNMYDSEDYE